MEVRGNGKDQGERLQRVGSKFGTAPSESLKYLGNEWDLPVNYILTKTTKLMHSGERARGNMGRGGWLIQFCGKLLCGGPHKQWRQG